MLRYGVMAASQGGKLKTVVQAVASILYLLPLPDSGPALVRRSRDGRAFIITVLTGLDYIREAVKLRRRVRTGQ